MAEVDDGELVEVRYLGPDPLKAFEKDNKGNVVNFNFVKGQVVEKVPLGFAKYLIGEEMNSRKLTTDQMDLARAYDHHLFEIVGRHGAAETDDGGDQ